ncbi:hypothetical protein HKD37_07G018708 [Glycine soja]
MLSEKRTRGYTHMLDVWDTPDGEFIFVEVDPWGNLHMLISIADYYHEQDFGHEQEEQCRENEKNLQERTTQPSLEEAQSSESSSIFPELRESDVGASEIPIMVEDQPRRVTLEDYSRSTVPQFFTSIVRPEVQAHNITYPHSLIQLIQGNLFHGLPNEDPYAHLATYIEICNTVKIVCVPEDAIRLSLFSFSLSGEAKRWLHSFKGNSLKTWDEVVEKFLKKYFPESKTTKGKAAISSFHQFPNESLSEALKIFRSLLQKTPTHGFFEPIQLNIFINGLRPQSKQLLDASIGGKIKLKTLEEAMELIENMAASDYAILRDRTHIPTKRSLLELSSQDALLAQNKLLAKQLETLTETLSKLPTQLQVTQPSHSVVLQVGGCSICGGAHESSCCIPLEKVAQEVNYMGNQHRPGFNVGGFVGFQQGSNFNPNQGQWKSHPGNQFNKDQGGPSNRPQNQGPSLYERTTKLEETLAQFIQVTMPNHKRTETAIKNLEIQNSFGSFRANTENNPKEECKVVMTIGKKAIMIEGEGRNVDEQELVAEKEKKEEED